MNVQELSNASMLKLVSFLWWGSLYLICAVRAPQQGPEWCSRAITLFHGSISTIIGFMQCLGTDPFSKSSYVAKITPANYALMVWSWGYFAFDLFWCMLACTESSLMLCHHITSLVAITLYMKKEFTGCTFACSIAMMEITNPLLQTRWFLRNSGYEKTLTFTLIEGAYVILFLLVRGVFGTIMIYRVVTSDAFDYDDKIIGIVFYVVSVLFVWEIIGYCFNKYKNRIRTSRLYKIGKKLSRIASVASIKIVKAPVNEPILHLRLTNI